MKSSWDKICPLNSSPEKAIYCVGKVCAFFNRNEQTCSIPLITEALLEIKKTLEKTEEKHEVPES